MLLATIIYVFRLDISQPITVSPSSLSSLEDKTQDYSVLSHLHNWLINVYTYVIQNIPIQKKKGFNDFFSDSMFPKAWVDRIWHALKRNIKIGRELFESFIFVMDLNNTIPLFWDTL